ncbi:MAG TPA: acyltransferase [Terriglobales bacterium]
MGLLRLFLAAVVALGHFQVCILLPLNGSAVDIVNYLKLGHDAGHAVIFFFVISGFLISYALEHKYKTDSTGFYTARFLRIFPLYWFLYGLMIVFDYAGTAQNIKSSPVLDWLPGLILFGSDWAVSFLHYPDRFMEEFPAFLRQAWSLGAEVTFYALAPFLLLRRRLCVIVLLISIVIRSIIVYQVGFIETWSLHFFPATLMFFLLGHFSRLLYLKIGCHLGSLNHLWVPIFFGLSLYNVTTALPFDGWVFYLELVALVGALPFLFERTKDIRWMNVLGDQSYPLYLSHLLTMSLLAFVPTLLTQLGEGDQGLLSGSPIEFRFVVYAVAFLLGALLVSFLLHYLVEQPVSALGAQVLIRRWWWRVPRRLKPVSPSFALQRQPLPGHSETRSREAAPGARILMKKFDEPASGRHML